MHGLGVTEALGGLPAFVYVLFALLTQLGDVWFVFLLTTALYWLGEHAPVPIDRQRGAFLLALGLCALAVVPLLKGLFAVPRPPGAGPPARGVEAVPPALRAPYTSAATGDGLGFPSGHAFGSTVVYGGLALLLREYPRDRRVMGAAVVVALVSLSRLVLGVHHLLDVVAGVAGGLALLALAAWLSTGGERPVRVMALAVVAAALHTLLAGPTAESMSILGATVGGTAGWLATDRPPAESSSRQTAVQTAVLGLSLAVLVFAPVYVLTVNPSVRFLAAALTFGAVLVAPTVVTRWTGR